MQGLGEKQSIAECSGHIQWYLGNGRMYSYIHTAKLFVD